MKMFASERGKARIAGRKSGIDATSIRRKVKMKQDKLREIGEKSQLTLMGDSLIVGRQKNVAKSIEEFERKTARVKRKKVVGEDR